MLSYGTLAAQLLTCDATGTSTEFVSCDLCDLIDLINSVFVVAVGLLGATAVLFIVIAGFRYITAGGSSEQIEAAKRTLQYAIVGVAVVILSFVIVESALRVFGFTGTAFGTIACETPLVKEGPPGSVGTPPSQRPGQQPTGPGATGQWASQIDAAAKAHNIEPCALQSLVQVESGGDPDIVGHDGHNKNDDPVDFSNKRTSGLDWRYSHGIGLTQITIFPSNRYDGWRDSNTPSRKVGNRWYTVDDLIDPNTNLNAGAEYLSGCLRRTGSYEAAFGCYNGAGSGSSYATKVNKLFEQCKSEGANKP